MTDLNIFHITKVSLKYYAVLDHDSISSKLKLVYLFTCCAILFTVFNCNSKLDLRFDNLMLPFSLFTNCGLYSL